MEEFEVIKTDYVHEVYAIGMAYIPDRKGQIWNIETSVHPSNANMRQAPKEVRRAYRQFYFKQQALTKAAMRIVEHS